MLWNHSDFLFNKPENRRKKQGNDLHCRMTLHHRLSSSFPGVIGRVPCQQRPLLPGNRLAEGKETTDNQRELQASAAIPRGGRTVEGRFV